MFSSNGSPLTLSGSLDFSNLDNMQLNTQINAKNFQIIDAKKNARSEVYGKAFVDFMGELTGPVNNLLLAGKIDVLGHNGHDLCGT